MPDFADEVQRLMAERGMSLRGLARAASYDASHLSKILSGQRRPNAYLAARLDDVLDAGGRIRDAAAAAPADRGGGGADAGDDLHRRELLYLFSVAGALMAAPDWDRLGYATRGHGIDSETAAELAALNSHMWRVFVMAKSKRLVYPVVREQLDVLVSHLRNCESEVAYRRLCELSCDLFQLAGEILFDGCKYADAAQCYALAATAAREAGAHDLWACALTRHAFIALYERSFRHALPLLETAARLAQRGNTALSTRYWVSIVQAQAFAGLGDLRACENALGAAEEVHTLPGEMHNGGWLRFDGSRLAEERGACYVELKRPDLAETALTAALAGRLSPRRRGVVLTDLALLGVQRRDVGQVTAHASAALELARQTRSGVIERKLLGLQDRLESFLGDSRVRELDEQITALTRTRS
jgi:transcriptional regulator with XRE-family HTH domain